jgi:predicted RNA-binding protein with PUA-like domain
MSNWYSEFNSGFFLSITGLVLGSFATCVGYFYRSKCTSIKICGIIDVIRDVEAELDDTENIQLQNTSTTEQPQPQPQQQAYRKTSIRKSIALQEAINEAVKKTESKEI